ncbi:MAG: hypothetical protein O2894_05640 [Planctomycetota bacterium]|nr:hypothetical protein [Planctomycetota bacterium]
MPRRATALLIASSLFALGGAFSPWCSVAAAGEQPVARVEASGGIAAAELRHAGAQVAAGVAFARFTPASLPSFGFHGATSALRLTPQPAALPSFGGFAVRPLVRPSAPPALGWSGVTCADDTYLDVTCVDDAPVVEPTRTRVIRRTYVTRPVVRTYVRSCYSSCWPCYSSCWPWGSRVRLGWSSCYPRYWGGGCGGYYGGGYVGLGWGGCW